MANLNIAEFSGLGREASVDRFQSAQLPVITTVQNVTISGASAQSAALNASTGLVRLRTDIACAILVGTNPTALITSLMMDAGTTEYFTVAPGQSYKIAVIAI